ncbi:MAG: hypothetical protein ACNA78_11375 [Balneolaceae bacterium]
MKSSKRFIHYLAAFVLIGFGTILHGCDFLDPTEVSNPQATPEDLARAAEPVRAMMPGLEAQFARALGSNVVITETVSDNYSVHGTGISSQFDFPRQLTIDEGATNGTGATQGAYWNASELRALATFVIDDIIPGDQTASSQDIARVFYYRGMAHLFQGENFVGAVLEREGDVVPARTLLELAAGDFQESLNRSGSGVFATASRAALARTHRALGNEVQAANFATQVLNDSPTFLFGQPFDDNLSNAPYIFIVQRALKELQPLPRLDFLDPKYTTRESEIPVAKAEEMHLILAEAALTGAPDLGAARQHLINAINLANNESAGRVRVPFEENDQRLNNDLEARPRHDLFRVKASPDAPERENLVLTRPGTIETPTVSGTSFTEADINNAATADELIYLLYNLRQEILFLEGRRLHDLGIRLNIMLRELDANQSVTRSSLGVDTFVPAYIPSSNEMDLFDPSSPYPGGEPDDPQNPTVTTQVITIMHDLNERLTNQRGTVLGNPFVGVPGS